MKDSSTLRALILLAAIGLAACSPGAASGSAPVRNLIVVSLDTLRADRLGCYGYERDTSPTLDALASEGTVFDDASTTSPWTMPSHASLFTGTYPQRNGVIGFETALSPDVGHIATLLAGEEFQTFAVVSNSALTLHGLERGFQQFEYAERGRGPAPSDVTPRAIARFKSLDPDRRFFALIHYNGVHARYRSLPRYEKQFVGPYDGTVNGRKAHFFGHATGLKRVSGEDARHLSELYDACIRQLDDQLQTLLAYLRESGQLRDTLLIVTADHGEEFFDHGELNHAMSQYQELVRVPLILRGPAIPAGLRVSDPVSLIDILPTAMAALGLPPLGGLDGVDLHATWDGLGESLADRYLYFDADCQAPEDESGVLRPGTKRAIRDARFKLHYDMASEQAMLFDLDADPTEQTDVFDAHPREAQELLKALRAYLARAPGEYLDAPLNAEELRRLDGLGYVMGDG